MDVTGLEVRVVRNNKNITYWKDGVLVARKCSKCGEDKEISEFYLHNKKKGIYSAKCKECERELSKKYHENNIDKRRETRRKYYKNNIDKIRETRRKYYKNNSDKIGERNKQWREKNPDKVKEICKQWRENNSERKKVLDKQWRENNPNYGKEYFKNNKEQFHIYDKKSREKRKQNNLEEITDLLEQINPIFKELNLPIYGYLYSFVNTKTNHYYVGQTIQPLKRRYKGGIIKSWINDRKDKVKQKFEEELIEEDIEVIEVLDVGCCQYHLDKLEAYYINKFDSFNNGYNNNNGKHDTDDGVEEFNTILREHGLVFEGGKLIIDVLSQSSAEVLKAIENIKDSDLDIIYMKK